MNRLRIGVAVVVTTIWSIACVSAFAFNPALVGLVTVITPVMLAVVGWLFANEFLDQKKKNGSRATDIPVD